ncbi:MAG: hypothetical protein GQ535_02740 [Rhodobacteraceae bacterium]|nr:hypothetical protein [Paracoccaceae bacterium]
MVPLGVAILYWVYRQSRDVRRRHRNGDCCFVSSACLAKSTGFHGVEIFANYQGLIEQFWTPWFNRRTDHWGASPANRIKFSTETLRRIKVTCGQDFIVGLSISYLDLPGITLTLDDLSNIVVQHDDAGLIDYVTCGTGGYLDTAQLAPAADRGHSLGVPTGRAPEI